MTKGRCHNIASRTGPFKSENFDRKDFTHSEAVSIKDELEPEIKAAAQERMKNGKPSGNLPKGLIRPRIDSEMARGVVFQAGGYLGHEARKSPPPTLSRVLWNSRLEIFGR